jgi:hypothetical protein
MTIAQLLSFIVHTTLCHPFFANLLNHGEIAFILSITLCFLVNNAAAVFATVNLHVDVFIFKLKTLFFDHLGPRPNQALIYGTTHMKRDSAVFEVALDAGSLLDTTVDTF